MLPPTVTDASFRDSSVSVLFSFIKDLTFFVRWQFILSSLLSTSVAAFASLLDTWKCKIENIVDIKREGSHNTSLAFLLSFSLAEYFGFLPDYILFLTLSAGKQESSRNQIPSGRPFETLLEKSSNTNHSRDGLAITRCWNYQYPVKDCFFPMFSCSKPSGLMEVIIESEQ